MKIYWCDVLGQQIASVANEIVHGNVWAITFIYVSMEDFHSILLVSRTEVPIIIQGRVAGILIQFSEVKFPDIHVCVKIHVGI